MEEDEGEASAQLDTAREELTELLEKNPHFLKHAVELWPEIARVDSLISDAVRDVAVPEGFRLRLLDSIQAHKATFGKTQKLYKRRAWQLSLVATVIAASISVVMLAFQYFLHDHAGNWQKDQVLSVASKLFSEDPSASAKDLSLPRSEKEQAILDKHIASEDVLEPNAATWEVVDRFRGSRAVIYRFEDEHGNRAALFVVQQSKPVAGLIDRPPRRPQLMTAGNTAGAWQSDGLVYVLVSSGGEDAWRSLLVPQRPVT